jgi:glycerol-3-phosphate dehydrogenase subunit C
MEKGRDGFGKRAEAVSKRIGGVVEKGFDIVLSCPSCETMIKEEYPTLFNLLMDKGGKKKIHNAGAYLKALKETNPRFFVFHPVEIAVGYQIPCHARDPGKGVPYIDLLRQVPGLK